jgi:hypothetical protein
MAVVTSRISTGSSGGKPQRWGAAYSTSLATVGKTWPLAPGVPYGIAQEAVACKTVSRPL